MGTERYRGDEMIEISPEKEDVRHSDRGKRRAQITQPYGILRSPLHLPSCLSLQEEKDHLYSPPSLFPSTYILSIISLPSVLPCHTGVPAVLICLSYTPLTLTGQVNRTGSHPPSAHYHRSLLPLRLHRCLPVSA